MTNEKAVFFSLCDIAPSVGNNYSELKTYICDSTGAVMDDENSWHPKVAKQCRRRWLDAALDLGIAWTKQHRCQILGNPWKGEYPATRAFPLSKRAF